MKFLRTLLLFSSLLLSPILFAQTTEWTFLVYMAADNNLQLDALEDLKQMSQIGSSSKVKFIVLHDTLNPETSTKIYEIGKDEIKVVKDYERNIDSGNWEELVEFFKFSHKNFPARKFALTIWNHGSGWDKLNEPESDKGIAYDDHTGNRITTPQLGKALQLMSELRTYPLELVATDACLMQTIEVAYEISAFVQYYAASQEVEPYTGWPYEIIFEELVTHPEMDAQDLGKIIVNSYVQSQEAPKWSRTFSLIKLDQLDFLAEKLSLLSKSFVQQGFSSITLKEIIRKTQTFSDAETVDIRDFIRLLNLSPQTQNMKALLQEVEAAAELAIIYSARKGDSVINATGLSLWTPPWSIEKEKIERYQQLKFDQKTQWSKLVRYLYP